MNKELEANTTLSHYRIVSKLGAGGMGEVYLAQDTKLDRKVALKILPAELAANQDRMRRFVQEARAASALNHPNILTIYEIDQADSVHFIATESIDGETLRQRIRNAPPKLGEALDVAVQIAGALSAAHAAGIVHRDIKPENIMLRRDGIVKVLDFGVAKLTTESTTVHNEAPTKTLFKTDPGTVVGTAVYMSPEQARGIAVDARTDIFSLGVVLYEMVAGCLPFAGSTSSEVMASILGDKEPQPLARYSRAVPTELERIVTKALTKDREERYQTAKDLLIDLRKLKRKLEVDAEIDRTPRPETRAAVSIGGGLSALATASSAVATVPAGAAPGSSAEYIVSGIKQHKLAAAIALLVLVAGITSLGLYLRGRADVAIKSIAVMPFVNESGNPDVEYLSDGMTETLIGSLSQLPNLNVKARSLVFRYKGKDIDARTIGKDLNVQALLNGRVVQRGEDLTLYLELVDAQTGDRIWGDQYIRKQADLVSLQSEIALDVSQKLKTKLSGADEQKLTKKYTENAEAYQLYLKGRFFVNRRTAESLLKAIEYFDQAIAIDPKYALGYAGLSDSYLLLGLPDAITGALSPQDSLPKARAAAEKALQIDDSVGEVYFSLGQVKSKERDWAGAASSFDRGLRLSPNYPIGRLYYAVYLASLGRHDEAVKEIRRAQELDPLSLPINASVTYVLYLARRYDEAIAAGKKTLEMDAAFPLTHQRLGLAYVQKQLYREAILEFQQAANNSNRAPLVIVSLGHAYAVSGNKVEAQKVLAELKDLSQRRYVSAYSVAVIYAGLGEKEQAFQWLEKADEERSTELVFLKVDPRLDPLRNDSRFQELVKRVGVPQ